MKVMSFDEAIRDSGRYKKRHLLLGNGFSIACCPNVFVYNRLFEEADFTSLSSSARNAFDALSTQDFERVIKALRDAQLLASVYEMDSRVAESMRGDADGLREVLVSTIAASHPDRPRDITDDKYAACRSFIRQFNTIYTLNYDLLLYWAQMHTEDGEQPVSDDGFRKPEDNTKASYVVWEPHHHGQNIWFLHGALHLFDTGFEVQKYTWINTGIRLIEQIRNALCHNYFPLFVAEGTSEEKLTRIKHSDYLAKGYRSFAEISYALFIYGHSLSENDEHYLKLIERGKVRHVYVGIYGDPNSASNKAVMRRANRMSLVRGQKEKPLSLEVSFFDASSAKVWG